MNSRYLLSLTVAGLLSIALVSIVTTVLYMQAQGSNSQSCVTKGTGYSSFQGCNSPNQNPSNPNAMCDSGREFAANMTKGAAC